VNLYWNLSLGKLVSGPTSNVLINDLEFMRRDAAELRVYFQQSGSGDPVNMPNTMEIRFALKPYASAGVPDFDADPVVFTAAFSENADLSWSAFPSFNTTELNTAFAADPVSITFAAQLTMRPDSGSSSWSSTQTLAVTVVNDLIIGDEGTPTNATDPTDYLTAVQSEARYVRYDASQSLDSTEKAQARTNIGVVNQDIQQFTASGDWVNPSPSVAKLVDVLLIGGGGGGGSGRKGGAGNNIGGGGGGGAGSIVRFQTLTTVLSATSAVVIGAGGAGGAAVTAGDTNGNAGTAGGNTTLGGWSAQGGNAGAGGTTSGGAAGAARTNSNLIGSQLSNALAGGAGGAASNAAAAPDSENYLTTGGGGGGGISSANVLTEAGSGGGLGNSGTNLFYRPGAASEGETILLHGTGGGGGSPALTDSNAGSGYAGGLYGGGGGGGGAGQNDTSGSGSSGAGGAGANGIAIIITHL
jgi:hypothetical protein